MELSSSAIAQRFLPGEFPLGLFQEMVGVMVKGMLVLLLLCYGIIVALFMGPGVPTPKRWKRLIPPDSSGAGGEVGTFFLTLGLVEIAGDAWNLPRLVHP